MDDYEKINRMIGNMLASVGRKRIANFKKHPWKKSCRNKCVTAPYQYNHWTESFLLGHTEALQNVKYNLIKMFKNENS